MLCFERDERGQATAKATADPYGMTTRNTKAKAKAKARQKEWMANWSDLVDFEVHAVVTLKRGEREDRARVCSDGC